MKKVLLVGVGVLVLSFLFGAAGFAYAQTQNPPSQDTPNGFTPGRGMMGRIGQAGMMGNGTYGPMHEYMEQALAAKLGLSEEDIEEKLASGETMWTIAQAQGMADEEIYDLMLSARSEALKASVAAGTLTQEQADWMAARMQQKSGFGMGGGQCGGFGQGGAQRMPGGRWFNQP